MINAVKGLNYEVQIKKFLLKNTGNTDVYLWNEIPIEVFFNSGLFDSYTNKLIFKRNLMSDNFLISDTGIDAIYKNNKKQWVIVQCKNYTGTVCLDKLGGFFNFMLTQKFNGELYYTSKLSKNLEQIIKPSLTCIRQEYNNSDNIVIAATKLKPYYYQVEAYNKLLNTRKNILSLACGMGKTFASIMLAQHSDIIIIFSLYIEYARQNLERFEAELYDQNYKFVEVDSDNVRNADLLKQLIKDNKKIVFSATYKSSDIIKELVDDLKTKSVYVVVDEFHNLTKSYTDLCEIINFDSESWKFLFLSATPKIFKYTEDDEVEETTDEILGKVDNQYIFSFGRAIEENHICDYEVYVPLVTETERNTTDEIYKYMSDNNIDFIKNVNIDKKVQYLLRCMDENHSRCIVYLNSKTEIVEFKKSLLMLNEYYILDLYVDEITSDTSKKNREIIFNNFKTLNQKCILLSIKILDETVDILECDSVFIANKNDNKIRTIQRMCRAVRKNPNDPNKKAGVYLFCDTYSDITQFVANLKTFDGNFASTKVNLVDCINTKQSKLNREAAISKYKILDNFILDISIVADWKNMVDKISNFYDTNKRKLMTSKTVSEELRLEEKKMQKWIDSKKSYINKTSYVCKNQQQGIIDFFAKYPEYINSEYIPRIKKDYSDFSNKVEQSRIIFTETGKKIKKDNKELFSWFENCYEKYLKIKLNPNYKPECFRNEEYYKQFDTLMKEFNFIFDPKAAWFKTFYVYKNAIENNLVIDDQLQAWYLKEAVNFRIRETTIYDDKEIQNIFSDFIFQNLHKLKYNTKLPKLNKLSDEKRKEFLELLKETEEWIVRNNFAPRRIRIKENTENKTKKTVIKIIDVVKNTDEISEYEKTLLTFRNKAELYYKNYLIYKVDPTDKNNLSLVQVNPLMSDDTCREAYEIFRQKYKIILGIE